MITWLSPPTLFTMGSDTHQHAAESPVQGNWAAPRSWSSSQTHWTNSPVKSTAWLTSGSSQKPENSHLPANPCDTAVVAHVPNHTNARKWRITALWCENMLLYLLWISKCNQERFLIIHNCTFEIWMQLLDWGTAKMQTMKTVKGW